MQKDLFEAAQFLLLPIDGFRALIAKCLVHNGIQVELSVRETWAKYIDTPV